MLSAQAVVLSRGLSSGDQHGEKTEKETIYRDSETGRIMTEDYAKRHPGTTEKERVVVVPPKKKK
ncbi:hypothetical protein EJ071_23115 [Mesorhizobium sp. M1B.F.Ca.ET.045.04.1.1]|nr:hypothetical protein EJ071_23115 [Mesorhizobium sp. M1B.F.Ca.ET.045.04.1.1]